MAKILVDFHHAGLLNSLIMLFEDRLGYELYRPIGMEWAEQGFWKVYDHPATQLQYLSPDSAYRPIDGSKPLNNITNFDKDVYYCQDIDSGFYNKAIKLETFKTWDFDIVIASLPQHIGPFKKLITNFAPKAKLIYQVGNQWDGIYADNIMASAKLTGMPEGINHIEYHQEFDVKKFKMGDFRQTGKITSLMNTPEAYPDYQLLLDLEKQLIGQFRVWIHGGQGRNGPLHGSKSVASVMRSSQWLWHVKAGGDGYGHVLFNSAACGLPTIVKKSYYNGKLGEKLLIDGVTCLDIDNLSLYEIVEKIKHYSEASRWAEMSKATYQNFKKQVDFDKDEINIRQFIQRLI